MTPSPNTVEDSKRLYHKEAILKKEGSKNWVEYYAVLTGREMIFNRKDSETGFILPNNCTSILLCGKTTCGYGEKTCYRFPFWIRTSKGTYNFKCETKFQRYKWMHAVRQSVAGNSPETIPKGSPTKGSQLRRSTVPGSESLSKSLNGMAAEFSRAARVPHRRTQTENGDMDFSKQAQRTKQYSKIVRWDLAKPLELVSAGSSTAARKASMSKSPMKSKGRKRGSKQSDEAQMTDGNREGSGCETVDSTDQRITTSAQADAADEGCLSDREEDNARPSDSPHSDGDNIGSSMSKRFLSALERSVQNPLQTVRKKVNSLIGENRVRRISINSWVKGENIPGEASGSMQTLCSEHGSETSGDTNSTLASSKNSSRSSVVCSPLIHERLDKASQGRQDNMEGAERQGKHMFPGQSSAKSVPRWVDTKDGNRLGVRGWIDSNTTQAVEDATAMLALPGYIVDIPSNTRRPHVYEEPSKSLSWASLQRIHSPLEQTPRRENSAPPAGFSTYRAACSN